MPPAGDRKTYTQAASGAPAITCAWVFRVSNLFPYNELISSDPIKFVMFGKLMKSEDAGIVPAACGGPSGMFLSSAEPLVIMRTPMLLWIPITFLTSVYPSCSLRLRPTWQTPCQRTQSSQQAKNTKEREEGKNSAGQRV